MGDDHKPSIPRPVLAIDYSRAPYHHSLSPFTQPTKEPPAALTTEPHPLLGNSTLLENQALPINPDIPIKDVLFVFSGFSSYMKSPNQGATGVSDGDLRHAARLLEHARSLQKKSKRSRVYILHVKYRFIESLSQQTGEKRIPAPFATMLDPVLKIDQRSTGAFSPSVPQAIFEHMAGNINPPPRFIVWSQVGAKVTRSHMGTVSQWCAHAALPITMLSPYETRIRKEEPEDLEEAIDLELYATGDVLSPLGLHSGSNAIGNARPSSADQRTSHNIWPSNLASRRSSSMGWNSYYRAREKVMRQFGVVSASYNSSARRSIPQSTSSIGHFGIPGSVGPGELENLIDMLGLGDAEEEDVNDSMNGPGQEKRDRGMMSILSPPTGRATREQTQVPVPQMAAS